MKGFLDPLRVVTTHRLRNVALVAWCFLAFCLWYFPFVCIRLGTDTGETSGTLMDIYIRHAQTGGQLVHPKCHAQDDNQQTWENLTNQVRKIAFQSIFSLISNFRHRWFFQSMVISIIDERRGGRHQKKKTRAEIPRERPCFLTCICPETVTDPMCSFSPHAPSLSGEPEAAGCPPSTKQELSTDFEGHRVGRRCASPATMEKTTIRPRMTWIWGLWVVHESGWERRKVILYLLKSLLKFVIFSYCKYQQQ